MIRFKNGKLFTFDYESEEYVEVSQYDVGQYLNECVDLRCQPTLHEVLETVRNYQVLMLVFPRFLWLEESMLSEGPDGEVSPEDTLDRLVVSGITTYSYRSTTPTIDLDAMEKQGPTESGLQQVIFSYEDREYVDMEMYYDLHGVNDGCDETYSVGLTPLKQLLDLPVQFGKGYISTTIEDEYTRREVDDLSITLYDALSAIIEELTFHGGEDGKSELLGELNRRMQEVERLEDKRKTCND